MDVDGEKGTTGNMTAICDSSPSAEAGSLYSGTALQTTNGINTFTAYYGSQDAS